MPHLAGEHHPRAKLTADQVASVRETYHPGEVTLTQLAQEYCVSESSISRIINGITWVTETQLPDTTK